MGRVEYAAKPANPPKTEHLSAAAAASAVYAPHAAANSSSTRAYSDAAESRKLNKPVVHVTARFGSGRLRVVICQFAYWLHSFVNLS